MKRLIKKALKSRCKYKVAALGLDRSGQAVNCKFNRPRFSHKGGSIHAEMECIKDLRVRKIILVRVNKKGKVKKIHACAVCTRVLNKLGIQLEIQS